MKKMSPITFILAVCYIITLLPVLPLVTTVGANGITEKPYYLIDEEFAFVRPKDWPILAQRPSGWTVNAAGGELTSGYNTWFKITDSSNQLPVEMYKKFKTETDGFYTLEYRFNFTAMMEDTAWRVRNKNQAAVSLIVQNGNLCLETSNGTTVLGSAGPNKEIGVRADFDLSTKKITVYINGVLKASGVNFKENIDSIDNFQVITGKEAKGAMFLTPIKLYKNFVVNEKLISTAEGDFPSDWNLNNSGGSASVSKINSATPPDFFSLKLNDTSSSASVSMTKNIPNQTGPLSYEFKTMYDTKADGVCAGIYFGDGKVFEIATQNGGFVYTNAVGATVPVDGYSDYLSNLWYSFRVTLDTSTKRADLWINGRKAVIGIDLPEFADTINKLSFSTGNEAQGIVWLDDITLAANPPLPPNYVPIPQNNAAEDDILIGMQNCSLWREGHHLGWDYISGWPQRKPVLGFYDEGNTEVADWQTKFLVENGIDFQLTSWFRPNEGVDTPVKDPYTAEYALHQGYFYSEYSDMLKYAIYWENGGPPSRANGSDDFRNNFVPFWIEYYFKDPRYLKIDNKPVISILTYSGLMRDFGSQAGIKAEMDYLREECVKAGFAGAIILSIQSTGSRTEQQSRKASGIDALYAYGWDLAGKSVDYQMSVLTNQQNIGVMDIIPNLATGNDYTAWGHTLFKGGYATPEDFQRLAQWTKDIYMPRDTGLGNKLLLLGIWNEYGEGSYLMPTGLEGFGYLDAVRNAFLPNKTANNIIPGQASLIRMSRLYSEKGRYIPPIEDTRPPPTDTVVKGWYFDTTQDFNDWLSSSVSGFKMENGKLLGTATGGDPLIRNKVDIDIDINAVSYIKLTHKNSVPYAQGQIYFITDTNETWDEAKSVRYITEQEVEGRSVTYVYMQENKNWTGMLKRLRIDPLNNLPGKSFEFDSIELLEAEQVAVPTPDEYQEMPYTRPGDNAFPNYKFETTFENDIISVSSGASYAFGIWPGSGGMVNNTSAIQLDLNNMTRDAGGDYIEVKLKDGFAYQPDKKYGVCFWGYAPEQPYINTSNPNNSGGVAINLKWNDLYFGNNRYHKSTQINSGELNDNAGWKIKTDVIDLENLNGYSVKESDIHGLPTVKLCYNGGAISSDFGKGVFAYDNIYLTELEGEPRIHEIRYVVKDRGVDSIDVELEYPIKGKDFTGEDIAVCDTDKNIPVLKADLLGDMRTIRIKMGKHLPNGSYTVTLGRDVQDLWDRAFISKSADFTIDSEPLLRYEAGSFGIYQGTKEITGGTLPTSSLIHGRANAVVSNLATDGRLNLVMALYREGSLVDIRMTSADIEAGSVIPSIQTDFNVPSLDDREYTLKALLWEDLQSLVPIQVLSISR